jgi:cephalosporin-C deacetylase-like acetyl esterase
MAGTPTDFAAYWQATLDELATYAAAPQLEPIPLRNTGFATMYAVHLTSIGPYRIFAYLSIPHGEGPFPAICYAPRYQSVVQPAPQGTAAGQRSRYITLALAARGYRNADKPFAASIPGLLTEGIESPDTYIFRGIAADCVRGLAFLLTRPELDPARLVVVGNDMALITAALHPGATHAVATPELFHDTMALAAKTTAYPLEEINDHLRLHPESREAVGRTLSRFDLRAFAPRIRAKTLIMAGAEGSALDARALAPVCDAIRGALTVQESQRSAYKDGLLIETWIAEQCGIDDLGSVLPEAWR